MKKLLSLALILTMCFSLAACGTSSSTGSATKLEGNLSDLMTKVLEKADVDPETRTYVLERLAFNELTPETTEYYLGKSDYKYKEGYAAEPQINAQAFSVVLLRAESDADAAKLKDEIKTTVNPNKWICVGVDPSNVKTAAIGDVVILVMADESEKYIEAFNSLG